MRLLVLTSNFPYPANGGSKVWLAGFLDYAVATLGVENVVLCCVSSVREEADAALAPCRVVLFAPAPAILRGVSVAFNSLLLRRRAIQEMLTAVPRGTARRVGDLFNTFDPEIVLVDTVRMVQHLPARTRGVWRRVIYLEDLHSLRYRRMLSSMDDYPEARIDPLGTFRRFVPAPLCGLVRSGAVRRRLLAVESTILARREMAMPGQFDQVLLANPNEATHLSQLTGASNVSAIRPLLRRAPPRRGKVPKRCFTGEPTFLFLGNLHTPANSFGLTLFLRHAMPRFLARIPLGRLLIIGTGANRELRQLGASFGRQVSFAGYVENLDAHCRTAAAMVVPLVFGTGIKIKVIDALARGLPIISTSCGIEGFDLEPDVHCLVEDDLSRFADAMVRLLDPAFNADVTRRIQRYYSEHLAPEVVERSYRALLLGTDTSLGPVAITKTPVAAQH
jgi:glycosyltransferase involved in cell wall biosynthesis